MSHVAAIKTEFTDLPAMQAACKELGLVFKTGQKTFRWFGRWVDDYRAEEAAFNLGIDPKDYGKCEHAIEVPGCAYDIGVVKNPKGKGYLVAFDFWGPGQKIVQAIGEKGGKFTQRYSLVKAESLAKAKGLSTRREQQKDKILLRVTGNRF